MGEDGKGGGLERGNGRNRGMGEGRRLKICDGRKDIDGLRLSASEVWSGSGRGGGALVSKTGFRL